MNAAATRRDPGRAGRTTQRAPLRPAGLTVLYDASCPVCRKARRWVGKHRHLVPIRFVAAGSSLAQRRYPQLDVGSTLVDVTVVTDEGAVLRGDQAWIAVLWAVARTRPMANKLANGDGRRLFRSVKGATEAIRRLAAGQSELFDPRSNAGGWPPPASPSASPSASADESTRSACHTCRT